MKKNKKLESFKGSSYLFNSSQLIIGGGILDPKPYLTVKVKGSGPNLNDYAPDKDKPVTAMI